VLPVAILNIASFAIVATAGSPQQQEAIRDIDQDAAAPPNVCGEISRPCI
jgi:hypothetical protein